MVIMIKDFKIKESYYKLLEDALLSYLWEGIYKPMFDILEADDYPTAKNSGDEDIEWITVKGNHIPIKKGQTKDKAVKEWLEKKQTDKPEQEPTTDGIVRDVIKEVQKAIKEANCESTEPAEYYPKTIAGVKRGKPMTFAQADNGRANPHYNPKNPAYYKNCQSSVVAHELRMRGYDVQSAPRDLNPKSKSSQLAWHSSWAYIDPKTGKKCEYTKINVSSAKEHYNYLEKNVKAGERYQTNYYWIDDKNIKHGHVLTISRNASGELRLYDPQVNTQYIGKSIEKYYSRPTLIFNNPILKPKILRVDDKKLNPYFINDVVR